MLRLLQLTQPRACAPQQKQPLQWEACAAMETQHSQKERKLFSKENFKMYQIGTSKKFTC